MDFKFGCCTVPVTGYFVFIRNCRVDFPHDVMGIFNSRPWSSQRLPVDSRAADHMYVRITYLHTSSLNDSVSSHEFIVLVISPRLPARSKV